MRVDAVIPLRFEPSAQVELCRRVEKLGFDGAGLADHMEHGADVFTILGAAATQTFHIDLFPCVTNPLTRHPWVLANVANSMNHLAKGRFRMLIGAGDSAPLHIGRPPAKLKEMSAGLTTIRYLLESGFPASHAPAANRNEDADVSRPQIVLAVTGPRMTELAGELADGVLLARGFDPHLIAMARSHVERGAKRSGRSLEGFQILHFTLVHIENDREAAAEFGRARARAWIQTPIFKESLEVLGVPASAFSGERSLRSDNLDRLCESLYLIGPVEKIRERVQDIRATGAIDRLVCAISGPGNWTDLSASLASAIF